MLRFPLREARHASLSPPTTRRWLFAGPGRAESRPGDWKYAPSAIAVLSVRARPGTGSPVRFELPVELAGTLLREEEASGLEFHTPLRSRNCICQPVRPLQVEVDIVRPPCDEALGACTSASCLSMSTVWRQSNALTKAFDITRTFCRAGERPQVRLDRIVRNRLWPFVCRAKRLRRPIDGFVGEHGIQRPRQATGGNHGDKGFECRRRPVVVGVAIGEGETANALRVQGREYLADAAAAVKLQNQIHLVDLQCIQGTGPACGHWPLRKHPGWEMSPCCRAPADPRLCSA